MNSTTTDDSDAHVCSAPAVCRHENVKYCDLCKKVYCVDSWKGKGIPQDLLDEAKKRFDKRVKKYENKKIMKMDSMTAVEKIKDESLDMVYIDGAHDYKSVSEDIKEWLKKVKKGGLIAGHDFHNILAVRKAVGEILGKPDKIFSDYSWVKVK